MVGGRNITNLRFADDIDALAAEEQELETEEGNDQELIQSDRKLRPRYTKGKK